MFGLGGLIFSIFGGKLTRKVSNIIGTVIVILAIVGAFYALLDAYGDAKYREGEAHADAQWEEASDRLDARADQAAADADQESAQRNEDFSERLREERERLDEADEHGTSPLDVLFPPAGG